jgi:signal transduction histidine kinase
MVFGFALPCAAGVALTGTLAGGLAGLLAGAAVRFAVHRHAMSAARLRSAGATQAAPAGAERLELEIEVARVKERERRRWARNLHDEPLQSLGALRLAASTSAESEEREALTTVIAGLDEQIENLRRLIDGLRPTLLDELGLAAALTALIDRARRSSSVRVDVRLALGTGNERLPEDVELAVYRMVQEALNNAIRHASAETVRLAVGRRRDRLEVLVADDGRGFDVGAAKRGGGLTGMSEWASLAEGSLDIRSRIGTGTTIEAQVPLTG